MRVIAALLILFALASPVMAHGSPAVLDVERLMVQDEANDATYAYDGYDIQTIHLREVDWRPLDMEGVVIRIIASGGAVTPTAPESTLELDVAGATFSFRTSDDLEWQGDLLILEQSSTVGEFGETLANLQILVPFNVLNVTTGDELSGIAARSFAGDALVDAAPGGYYGPFLGESVPLPQGGSGEPAKTDLIGPIGYTRSNVTGPNTITVQSGITVAGQHITLALADDPAWQITIIDQPTAEVDASGSHEFALDITKAPRGHTIAATIYSDLGGRETGYLWIDDASGADVLRWSAEPISASGQEAPQEDSPGAGLLWVLAALGLAARRR